ncbi:MAG: UDP-N-acetylmuramate dehydrogenase [Bacteroidales bacterium]|nr:UDP-N-acetylmuramate dehydrogenase [Bacteroidales bacterium]
MKIFNNKELKEYNTFHISASCERLIQVEDEDEIPQLLACGQLDGGHFVIGEGSNVLFTQPFSGTVLQMCTKGIHIHREDSENIWIDVAAGTNWDEWVDYCIGKHYYGVENLVSIPGKVGSCPVQNIGAYGVEVKDVIDRVFGWRISSRHPFELANEACHFGYRDSIFKKELKNDIIITRVRFKLSKKEHFTLTYSGLRDSLEQTGIALTLENVAATVRSIRKNKLPDLQELGCAGSFFKNPVVRLSVKEEIEKDYPQLVSYPAGDSCVKLAAGQLIELAGIKGWREGNVGIYPKQALVIVNYGKATGKEVLEFYQKVQQKIQEKFGIRLEAEVNIL